MFFKGVKKTMFQVVEGLGVDRRVSKRGIEISLSWASRVIKRELTVI